MSMRINTSLSKLMFAASVLAAVVLAASVFAAIV